jgi:hypothetical protein
VTRTLAVVAAAAVAVVAQASAARPPQPAIRFDASSPSRS